MAARFGATQAMLWLMAAFIVMSAGCATAPQPAATAAAVADLQVVDCLLPGQVRRLGNSTYLSPRRPTRATAADCRIRGGEYVAYDRADYRTALNVWLEAAKAGDAEAQANVGEIFERGQGGEPNYVAAASWYAKAAEQGHARARFNLGTLYEQGLGVEKDMLEALNHYRQAWGLPEDDVIYRSAAQREQRALRAELESQLAAKQSQIQLLNRQMAQLEQQLQAQPDAAQLQRDLEQLRQLVADFEKERDDTRARHAALPVFREPAPVAAVVRSSAGATREAARGLEFGKYFALVIGNQNYNRLEDLATPHRDALEVAQLLENKYGFSVQTLLDVSNVEVMQAINALNEVIGPADNLLIYYAGHGSRLQAGELETGYWLPVNAEPPPSDTFWVANEFVTRHLARLQAKRVLVVADSCYAGLLSNAPGYLLMSDQRAYDAEYLRYKLAKKARLLLASGADKPVLDNAGAGHSLFARAFIDVLRNNDRIIAGPELFTELKRRVQAGAAQMSFEQQPQFKAIKGAGHEVGDFFFVPRTI